MVITETKNNKMKGRPKGKRGKKTIALLKIYLAKEKDDAKCANKSN